MRGAVRRTRSKERLVVRSDAEVRNKFERRRQRRLKTIRLVLTDFM